MVDFRQEVGNKAHKLSSMDHLGLVYIDRIPIHMPGKCCQYIPVAE